MIRKNVVMQIAPAVRVAIGEAFGYEPGENTIGKLIASLRKLGVDAIFDTSVGSRPYHYGRVCGVSRDTFRRRTEIPTLYFLLSGLDPFCGDKISAPDEICIYFKIPDGDVWSGHQRIL